MSLLPVPINKLTPFLSLSFFIFARVSSFFLVAPFFNEVHIPKQVKLLLSFFFTVLIFSQVNNNGFSYQYLFSIKGVVLVIQQVIIGLAIGFILKMTFEILHLSGHFIATSMQLNFAMSFSGPSGHQENILGTVIFIFGLFMFMALNGPLYIILLLVKSFTYFPIKDHFISAAQIKLIPAFTSNMFQYSLLLSLPVLSTLLLSNLSLAIMTRLSPSMNIFSIGFPISMLVGLLTLMFSLPFILMHFGDIVHLSFNKVILLEKG